LGVNIADETSVQAGFKSVMEEFGQVDSVVNSAVCLTSCYTKKRPMHPNLISNSFLYQQGIVENFTAEACKWFEWHALAIPSISGHLHIDSPTPTSIPSDPTDRLKMVS
jgi:hypothetical protein